MSNIVEPQIVEKKPNWDSDFIKNNPFTGVAGGINPNGMFTRNYGEPYVFLKDFSFIHGTNDGSIGSTMVNFKKDQVVYPFQSSPNAKFQVNPAFTKAINEKVLVPQKPISVKSTTNELKNKNLLVGDVLTAEDKFYQKLGIKYHNTQMFGVASRIKGRFLLALALDGGYFVYKKFKK